MKTRFLFFSLIGLLPVFAVASRAASSAEVEVREFEGKKLSPFDRDYDNSIRGPQMVDPAVYRLKVEGLVQTPLSLAYREVLGLPGISRAVTLYCVEGWSEHLLFEGVRLADLFSRAGVKDGVKTVIFHAADGYSSSLPWEFVKQRDLMLAARINGKTLDAMRGFPFQVVAEDKYGYKWVKWVVRIELSDKPYSGYWESRGYSNQADLPEEQRGK